MAEILSFDLGVLPGVVLIRSPHPHPAQLNSDRSDGDRDRTPDSIAFGEDA